MDLSTLYDHEQLYPLDITDPGTGKRIGLKVQLRSAESAAVKAIGRAHADETLALQKQGRDIDAEISERFLYEKTATLVAGWDWLDDTVWKGEKPPCTREKIIEVFKGASFVFTQVVNEAAKIENFTGRSKAISPNISPIKSATG